MYLILSQKIPSREIRCLSKSSTFCHLCTHLLFWSEFWCHLQILGLVTGNSPFNFVPSPFFVIFVVCRTTVNTITALTFIWIFKFSFNFCSFLFLLFYWKQKKNGKVQVFCEIFPLLLTVCTVVKSKGRFRKILWPSQNIWTLKNVTQV